MTLSDDDIQATKVPYGKNQFKVSDGAGLYLLVKASGRYWKLAYRFSGKQKTLAFGVYPTVSIEQAREKRDIAKQLLANNIDPGEIRKQERIEQRETNAVNKNNSFASSTAERKTPQPVLIDPVALKDLEQRRLCVLQALATSNTYSANERSLQQIIDRLGFQISFDRLRTDIAWLCEQQAVQIQIEPIWIVYLTQSGLDAVQNRTWIPGINRPVL